ncbi:MAG TPA: hypothetical protein VFM21_05970 [Terriglobia bacterium]|nr:hypothetical protein [Terriglobia bacterium]
MNSYFHSLAAIFLRPASHPGARRFACAVAMACLMFVASCAPPVKQPIGPERDYLDATDLFKKSNFDRALQYTEGLASASPATPYTERARVLRIVIFGSRVKAYIGLADSYAKGIEATKNPRFKAEYERVRNDALQYGSRSALALAEEGHRMMAAGIGKEVVLEAPYPDTEGPTTISQLNPMLQGGWIEPADQEAAARASLQKWIDDELALAVGGDRSKARTALAAGPVKISDVDFGIFLGKELLAGAGALDRKHYRDYQKFKLITGEADAAAQAVLDMLKASPDKDKEKAAKKLQADIKDAVKKNS